MANHADYKRQWRKANHVKVAFQCQRAQARARGIQFLLTFEEWWAIWQESGKWADKGTRKHQYCMARTNDNGRRNISEGQKRRPPVSEETRHKLSVSLKAKPPFSEEWRRNLSKAREARPPMSEETRRKISDTLKARPAISEEARRKLRAAQQARRARESGE